MGTGRCAGVGAVVVYQFEMVALHKQLCTKANVRVDEGVVGIIDALSNFPLLETVESCQGHGNEAAWVCFLYGTHPWLDIFTFGLGFLAPELFNQLGDGVNITLRPLASGLVMADLTIRQEALGSAENTLRKLAKRSHAHPRLELGDSSGGTFGTFRVRC